MMLCKKCGCALNSKKGFIPQLIPRTASFTGPLRDEKKVQKQMINSLGYRYSCPNKRWWKPFAEHDDYWEKLC